MQHSGLIHFLRPLFRGSEPRTNQNLVPFVHENRAEHQKWDRSRNFPLKFKLTTKEEVLSIKRNKQECLSTNNPKPK